MFTGNASVMSMAVLIMVEEARHSLGHQLIFVRDEAFPRATDTFAAEQGVGGEAGRCVPLVWGLLHFVSVQ